jgi:hypothetical protein
MENYRYSTTIEIGHSILKKKREEEQMPTPIHYEYNTNDSQPKSIRTLLLLFFSSKVLSFLLPILTTRLLSFILHAHVTNHYNSSYISIVTKSSPKNII